MPGRLDSESTGDERSRRFRVPRERPQSARGSAAFLASYAPEGNSRGAESSARPDYSTKLLESVRWKGDTRYSSARRFWGSYPKSVISARREAGGGRSSD